MADTNDNGNGDARSGDEAGAAAESGLQLDQANVERVLERWKPVITAVVDASRGDQDAASDLERLYEHLEGREDWHSLPKVLRKIVAGERDRKKLEKGLDVIELVIVRGILAALGEEHPLDQPVEEGAEEEAGAEGEEEPQDDITALDEFLSLIAMACSPFGSEELTERLREATAHMANDKAAPAESRALGQALGQVLEGNPTPDLSGLVPAHADRVQALLDRLAADVANAPLDDDDDEL